MAKLTDAKVRALRLVRDGRVTFWGVTRGPGSPWSGPKDAHASSLYALREAGLITTLGFKGGNRVELTEAGAAALAEVES